MYNLELDGSKLENVEGFVQRAILKPLGFEAADKRMRKVKVEKEDVREIAVFSNSQYAVYLLGQHKGRYVVSFQRKSILGTQKIMETLDGIFGHPAIIEKNEEDYFVFA